MGRGVRIAAWTAVALAAFAAAFALTRKGPAPGGALGTLLCPYGVGEAGDTDGSTVLTYEKGCQTTADCAIGPHYMSCCGTSIELGIHQSELSRFTRHDGVCGVRATCRCMGMGDFAEDGHVSRGLVGVSDITVACVAGQCVTSVIAAAATDAATPPAVTAPIPTSSVAPLPTATASAVPTSVLGGLSADGCRLPSPADCSDPGGCKPSTCVCRQGGWLCTPDCGGCVKHKVAPVPFDGGP